MRINKRVKAQGIFPSFDDSRFRALIEKSSDVIVLINPRGKILYASPSIVRLYGRTYDEILGINGLKYVHPVDIPMIVKLLADLVLHPNKTLTAECRIKHKSGKWRWVIASGTNLLHDKNVKGIVVNFHDITERKKLEELKDEFLGIASHELKTPITALKGYIQILIMRYGKNDEQLRNSLLKIDEQMNRLAQLISELLDISRIQEGKIQLKKEVFNIGPVIKEVVEDMQQLTEVQQILLKDSVQKKINADKYRFTQVLINLLSNAIKYAPESSKIIVRSRVKNGFVFISVRDFGVGIAKKNYKKIFERFYQESTPGKQTAGLGLGLYISCLFIKEHGGKIWVRSKVGKGSLFTFTLPTKIK